MAEGLEQRQLAVAGERDLAAGVTAFGDMALDQRFEPGERKEVTLVEFGGTGELFGLNNLTDGSGRSDIVKADALRRARERGYKGA